MQIVGCTSEVKEKICRAAKALGLNGLNVIVTCSPDVFIQYCHEVSRVLPSRSRELALQEIRELLKKIPEYTIPLLGGNYAVYIRPDASLCDIYHALGHAYLHEKYKYVVTALAVTDVLCSSLDAIDIVSVVLMTRAKYLANAIQDIIVDSLVLHLLASKDYYVKCIERDLHEYEIRASSFYSELDTERLNAKLGEVSLNFYSSVLLYCVDELLRDYYKFLVGKYKSTFFENLRESILSASSPEDMHKIANKIVEYYFSRVATELLPLGVSPPRLFLKRDDSLSSLFKAWTDVLEFDMSHLVVVSL